MPESYNRAMPVAMRLRWQECKDQRNMTLEDYQEMARGLMGYFGTYQVDEANQKLVIKMEAAANPALTGTTIEREYILTDTTLTMIVPGNPATLNVV